MEQLRTQQIAASMTGIHTVSVQLPDALCGDDPGGRRVTDSDIALIARLATGSSVTGVTEGAVRVVDEVNTDQFKIQLDALRRSVFDGSGGTRMSASEVRVSFVRQKAVALVHVIADRAREVAAAQQDFACAVSSGTHELRAAVVGVMTAAVPRDEQGPHETAPNYCWPSTCPTR